MRTAPLVERVLAHEMDCRQLERSACGGIAIDLYDRWLRRIGQGVNLLLAGGRLGLV